MLDLLARVAVKQQQQEQEEGGEGGGEGGGGRRGSSSNAKFGAFVASELDKMDERQQRRARFEIHQVLFEMQEEGL